ncbi:Uncharacterised protein [Klebsiella michiganensis]|uniref:Uncharacterized protein n=1 Tax=Klebsiella michiganensis TaxID=1134687 RepID=A0A7H4PMA3_9ENTR|nr:Uncharacterised protein [Klebsiella michiganensis]
MFSASIPPKKTYGISFHYLDNFFWVGCIEGNGSFSIIYDKGINDDERL